MEKSRLALELLPEPWRRDAASMPWQQAEEIRLRMGQLPSMLVDGRETAFHFAAVTREDLFKILEKATGASMHASVHSLSEGYVNYRGLRVGVCGEAILREGRACAFHQISSLAVRIPRECRGVFRETVELWLRHGFENTLVCAPPGVGKTTALRELIRALSNGGIRIGVADERNELAALDRDGTGFDLGRCTDVITGVGKREAARMLLRGMNEQIVAMDEITAGQDETVLEDLAGCGVGLLASVHGRHERDLRMRESSRRLLEGGLFTRLLCIEENRGVRRYSMERIGP